MEDIVGFFSDDEMERRDKRDKEAYEKAMAETVREDGTEIVPKNIIKEDIPF